VIKRCVRLKLLIYCHAQFYSVESSAQDKLAEVNIAKSNDYPSHAPLIGAYDYPWHGVNGFPVCDDWRIVLRQSLCPAFDLIGRIVPKSLSNTSNKAGKQKLHFGPDIGASHAVELDGSAVRC
jgi:hypothetical protein